MEDDIIKKEKKTPEFLKKKEVWISVVTGIIIGAILMYLLGIMGFPGLGHSTVVTFKGGRLTQSSINNEMNKYDVSSYIFQIAESKILEKEYKLTAEQLKEIEDNANSIIDSYKKYGYTEEDFLVDNGFETKEDLINYLKLDYRRKLCKADYLKNIVPKEDVENYYNENNVYGQIDTKHILVQVTDKVSDKEALEVANDIIKELKSGENFEDVAYKYNDKAILENVSFDTFSESQLDENYVQASKELEVNGYTETPVKSQYGYHIIYCINKADKPELSKIEDKILEAVAVGSGINIDVIDYKSTIELCKKYKLEFKDKKLQEKYVKYCEEVEKLSSESSNDTDLHAD